jgi:hypothetical protein
MCILGYVQIDSICVICCSLFLLASDTHGLQLATGPNSPSQNIDVCLRTIINELR